MDIFSVVITLLGTLTPIIIAYINISGASKKMHNEVMTGIQESDKIQTKQINEISEKIDNLAVRVERLEVEHNAIAPLIQKIVNFFDKEDVKENLKKKLNFEAHKFISNNNLPIGFSSLLNISKEKTYEYGKFLIYKDEKNIPTKQEIEIEIKAIFNYLKPLVNQLNMPKINDFFNKSNRDYLRIELIQKSLEIVMKKHNGKTSSFLIDTLTDYMLNMFKEATNAYRQAIAAESKV